MICLPCQEGGRLNADAQRVYSEESKRYLVKRALQAHADCPGCCECHHAVGDFTNRRSDG